ncbi:MAG: biotin synthase BioB [Chlamydiia bacterium]|nr:biotin synthase BioB [Chlamydiia bacterium]
MSHSTSWTREQVESLYHSPLIELLHRAAETHRQHHNPAEMQVCKLLSIKTGGCPEDCKYCSQSAHHNSPIKAEPLMEVEEVLTEAKRARDRGCTRFCMGAAWRRVRNSNDFDRVIEMVKGVRGLGMEVCVTLGLLSPEQAQRLKEAGLYAYNHNLDTGPEYYKEIISTRSYEDRLNTLDNVRSAGISVCCGGIIGLGESDSDRIDLLHTLANLPEPPESVPINALAASPGTPLEHQEPVTIWEMVRMIATARILMPSAIVRLTAGRDKFSNPEQTLCFMAGANSIFIGEKLLTDCAPLPTYDADKALFSSLGLTPREPYKEACQPEMAGCGC